jgi:hypothetical protein
VLKTVCLVTGGIDEGAPGSKMPRPPVTSYLAETFWEADWVACSSNGVNPTPLVCLEGPKSYNVFRYAIKSVICGAVNRGHASFFSLIMSSIFGPCCQSAATIVMWE